jgi:hypothetical protein
MSCHLESGVSPPSNPVLSSPCATVSCVPTALLLQDAASLKGSSIRAHIFGPVTLGSTETSDQLITNAEGLVEEAWVGNDTTGQPGAESARSGGRACVEVPAAALQGTCAQHMSMSICSKADSTRAASRAFHLSHEPLSNNAGATCWHAA